MWLNLQRASALQVGKGACAIGLVDADEKTEGGTDGQNHSSWQTFSSFSLSPECRDCSIMPPTSQELQGAADNQQPLVESRKVIPVAH
jgi:hypothetical protein